MIFQIDPEILNIRKYNKTCILSLGQRLFQFHLKSFNRFPLNVLSYCRRRLRAH